MPFGADELGPRFLGVRLGSISILEGRETEEGADQREIVAFHDDSGGESEREHDGPRVELEGLSDGHGVLALRRLPGVVVERGNVRDGDAQLADGIVFDSDHAVVVLDAHDGGLAPVGHDGEKLSVCRGSGRIWAGVGGRVRDEGRSKTGAGGNGDSIYIRVCIYMYVK